MKARRIAVMSQRKDFGFMAAPIYGQWICHSPNVMKTDIIADPEGSESGKTTRGSIRFDSLTEDWVWFVIDQCSSTDRPVGIQPNTVSVCNKPHSSRITAG